MLLTPLVCNVHSFNRSFYYSLQNFYIIKLILVEFGSLSGGACRWLWLVVVELAQMEEDSASSFTSCWRIFFFFFLPTDDKEKHQQREEDDFPPHPALL